MSEAKGESACWWCMSGKRHPSLLTPTEAVQCDVAKAMSMPGPIYQKAGNGLRAPIPQEDPRGVDKGEECTQTFTAALDEFKALITEALNGKAESKGYSSGGDSGGRPMLDAVALIAGEGTHPIGEIIYKLSRWKAKRNPEDLVKAAAWAFLMWDQQKREGK